MFQQQLPESPVVAAARMLGALILLMVGLSLTMMGCERREKVLDVEAPDIDLEVDKTTSPDGNVGIDVDADDEN